MSKESKVPLTKMVTLRFVHTRVLDDNDKAVVSNMFLVVIEIALNGFCIHSNDAFVMACRCCCHH